MRRDRVGAREDEGIPQLGPRPWQPCSPSCMRLHARPSLTRAISEHTVAAVDSRLSISPCASRCHLPPLGRGEGRGGFTACACQLGRGLARLFLALGGTHLQETGRRNQDCGLSDTPWSLAHQPAAVGMAGGPERAV